MKVSKFAVSVQWGNGRHYFARTDLTSKERALKAFDAAEAQHAKVKRGFKPKVYLWEKVEDVLNLSCSEQEGVVADSLAKRQP